jgi:ATP-binding cassette subfamily B (MDR/TAP) protein 1
MSFYDNPKNGAGALATRLATDASAVQGATGARLGMIMMTISSIGVGLVIAFCYSWKFALFNLGVMPFAIAFNVMQMKFAKGFSSKNRCLLEGAGKVASEAILNIRTVASHNKEEAFLVEYTGLIEPNYRQSMKTSHVFGIAFAFSQAMVFFCDAAIFYFGAWLIAYQGLDYEAMFKVFAAVIFSAMSLGRESQLAPDYGKAKISGADLRATGESAPDRQLLGKWRQTGYMQR